MQARPDGGGGRREFPRRKIRIYRNCAFWSWGHSHWTRHACCVPAQVKGLPHKGCVARGCVTAKPRGLEPEILCCREVEQDESVREN